MAYTSFASFVRKNPITSAAVTIALGAAGINFIVKAPSNNNATSHQIQTQDGRSQLIQTGSGSQTQSGNLLVGDQKTGSGKVAIDGSDGGKLCVQDTDGGGYTRFDCLNGTCTAAIATGNECP